MRTSPPKKDTYAFDQLVFTLLGPFVRLYMRCTCRFITKPLKPKEQFILVSNHLTERDFFLAVTMVKAHMYLVASEHLKRGGFWLHLGLSLIHPIFRAKGATDTASALEMMRRTRKGYNLLLFPEGHRSADGVTVETTPALGKLIRRSGCTLITMRLTGGYFCEPRWAHTVRKGEMTAGIQGVYSPDTLKKMTDEQVAALIDADIYEDAWERQRRDPKPYRGRALAEGLENHLFLCPKCRGISTLHTRGDSFWCDCGMHGRYDVYARLTGDLPVDNVRDWTLWQETEFARMYEAGPIRFSDDSVSLYRITRDHVRSQVDSGTLTADRDCLQIGETAFDFADISAAAFMDRGNSMFFETASGYWQMYGAGVCMMKYMMLWKRKHGKTAPR